MLICNRLLEVSISSLDVKCKLAMLTPSSLVRGAIRRASMILGTDGPSQQIEKAFLSLMDLICCELTEVVQDWVTSNRGLNLDETILLGCLSFSSFCFLLFPFLFLLPLFLILVLRHTALPAFLRTGEWALHLTY